MHGGLLGVRGNALHEQQMAENGITPIDLMVLNLYAFEHTVAKGGDFATCIENIDIGGPSSAKNHKYVVIATAPSQYKVRTRLQSSLCAPLPLHSLLLCCFQSLTWPDHLCLPFFIDENRS